MTGRMHSLQKRCPHGVCGEEGIDKSEEVVHSWPTYLVGVLQNTQTYSTLQVLVDFINKHVFRFIIP